MTRDHSRKGTAMREPKWIIFIHAAARIVRNTHMRQSPTYSRAELDDDEATTARVSAALGAKAVADAASRALIARVNFMVE